MNIPVAKHVTLTRTIRTVSYAVGCMVFGAIIPQFAPQASDPPPSQSSETGPKPELPSPKKQLIPKVKIAEAIGWQDGATPKAAEGFAVNLFAKELDHPRWLYVLPNGDVLVAETNAPERKDDRKGLRGWFMKQSMSKAGAGTPSANRLTLLRDVDGDGVAEFRSTFVADLKSPFGMALVGSNLYVANTDGIVMLHYSVGDTVARGMPETVAGLPGGTLNHHWTKNLIADEGKNLYATVGSNSNVGEHGMNQEYQRACILKIDLSTKEVSVFASGLRNPNGLAWHPRSGKLWTAVNERDEIGDRLVPDYITSVQSGGFYGWPHSYYGQHVDERVHPQDAALVAKAIAPDFAVGAHTASLGLVFYDAAATAPQAFPERFRDGAFIGQHGSWNRSEFAGYKVTFVPFDGSGAPVGPMEDFVTGFLRDDKAMGRPVGVVVDRSGALLIADDVGNSIWRVVPEKSAATVSSR